MGLRQAPANVESNNEKKNVLFLMLGATPSWEAQAFLATGATSHRTSPTRSGFAGTVGPTATPAAFPDSTGQRDGVIPAIGSELMARFTTPVTIAVPSCRGGA